MYICKKIMLDVYWKRHELTKLLRLDMHQLKKSQTKGLVDYYEGHMLGITAAYYQLGIIDMKARHRYIEIIVDTAFKRRREILTDEV